MQQRHWLLHYCPRGPQTLSCLQTYPVSAITTNRAMYTLTAAWNPCLLDVFRPKLTCQRCDERVSPQAAYRGCSLLLAQSTLYESTVQQCVLRFWWTCWAWPRISMVDTPGVYSRAKHVVIWCNGEPSLWGFLSVNRGRMHLQYWQDILGIQKPEENYSHHQVWSGLQGNLHNSLRTVIFRLLVNATTF